MKKDYNALRDEIISEYETYHNVNKVSRRLHIAPAAASTVLQEAGITLHGHGHKPIGQPKPQLPPDSCAYCRSCSRLSSFEGYCLKHRRTIKLRSQEPCFN